VVSSDSFVIRLLLKELFDLVGVSGLAMIQRNGVQVLHHRIYAIFSLSSLLLVQSLLILGSLSLEFDHRRSV